MVCDSIENFIKNVPALIPSLKKLTPLLEAVQQHSFEELCAMDFAPLDLRFNEYDTQPAAQVPFEAHVKNWDLQLVLEGAEYIGCAPLETLAAAVPYDEKEDIAFYSGVGQKLLLEFGTAVLLAPWDGHQPGVSISRSSTRVKKIVVKLPVPLN